MIEGFIKKVGQVATSMARDFFLLETGNKIFTLDEYTERLGATRGSVRNGLAFLENEGCVVLEKNGKSGTTLLSKDMDKLLKFANWDAINGSMPLPSNNSLASLASAVCAEMRKAPLPFTFAYMTGSDNRLKRLRDGIVDFIIVSQTAAKIYLEQHDDIEEIFSIKNCSYSRSYALYFADSNCNQIKDGMRVAIDRNCADVVLFTERECEGHNIEYVDIPYTQVANALNDSRVDCAVYRKEEYMSRQPFNCVSLINSNDSNPIPTLLARKENYRLADYIRSVLDTEQLAALQYQYITGQLQQFFY